MGGGKALTSAFCRCRLPRFTVLDHVTTMRPQKTVLLVGIIPALIDFSNPAYAAYPGLDASKVQHSLDADEAALNQLGYQAELCLTDLGATAEDYVREKLQTRKWDCVLIGAGMRNITINFLLFEKIINVIHTHAPHAKLCFNTRPDDTAAAVQRWV